MVLKSLDWWAISMGRVCTMSRSNGIWQRLMHIGNNIAKIAPHICTMQTTSYIWCDNIICFYLKSCMHNASDHTWGAQCNPSLCCSSLWYQWRLLSFFACIEAFSCRLASCEMLCMARFFHFSFKGSAALYFVFAFYHFRFSDLQRICQKENTFLLVHG